VATRTREREPDALIVGGGVIGLACAWRAAQRGLAVRVLERDAVGGAASRVAAGMLAPVGEAYWGEDRALALALASAEAWPRFARELTEASGVTVSHERSGALHVALDRDEAEELQRRLGLYESLGLEAQWLRPRRCRELEPGLAPACAGGVHVAGEASVDPRVVTRALAAAAARAGAEIVEDADVTGAIVEGGRLAGVRTADGEEHAARTVVLAAGAWAGAEGWLPAELAPPVRPVKGQLLVLRAPSGRAPCAGIVASERVYLVPRADGRLVVGATVEEAGFDTTVTAGGVLELLREAYRALPEVSELSVEEALAGLRPGTPDNVPLVGRGEAEGLLLATGHFRNGVLMAPITAEIVASLLTGDAPPPEAAAADPARLARSEAVA
jgi:glycine oxidase